MARLSLNLFVSSGGSIMWFMMSKDDVKKKIVADLKPLNPKKVVLFGSFNGSKFVNGKSDIDLLVVKDSDKKSMAERYGEARLALKLDFPFDIFVLTEKELKDRLSKSFFFREIVEKGEVLL